MADVFAWLLIILPAIPFATVWVLVRHVRSDSPSLAERSLVAVRDWLVSSMAGMLALNRIFGWGWSVQLVVLILGTAMVLVSLPSAWWLWQYHRGAFR